MKYVTLFAVLITTFFTFAKTLEEVQSQYTDGTIVYNFRYQGSGQSRVRIDTIKLPDGKITLNKVNDAEKSVEFTTIKDRDYERLSKLGTVISVTTNDYKVTYVYRKSNEEDSEIFIKLLQKSDRNNIPVSATKKDTSVSYKKSNSSTTQKKPWQYNHSDIIRYTDNSYSTVSTSLLSAIISDETNEVNSITKQREENELKYDGGYYIMNDGGRVSYRDALNQGWADEPTTELQLNVFNEVTSDPNSLWTKRNLFDNYPLFIKQKVKRYSKGSREYRNFYFN